MTSEILKYASKILREEYPRILISRTVDVFKGLNSTERQILVESQKIFPPRLMRENPRQQTVIKK